MLRDLRIVPGPALKFGPAAFYLKGVTPPGITLSQIFGSIWPYLILQVIVLGLVIAFPQIALWLPSTMAN